MSQALLRSFARVALPLSLLALLGGLQACGGLGTETAASDDEAQAGEELTGATAGGKVKTTTNVNFRTGPSTSKTIIDVLPKDTELTLVKATPSGGFYQVDHEGTVGWVSGKYLVVVKTAPVPGPGGGPAGSPLCATSDLTDFQPPTSCNGATSSTSKQKPSNSVYSSSWFGCYFDAAGKLKTDPSDNCQFACGASAYCAKQGPECQANLRWFAADVDRFGCGAKIRVTNCKNNKTVVLVALDRGPNCTSIEKAHDASVLDMSHDAMGYLFDGKYYGGGDHKAVVVEEVAASTPLGPTE